MFVQPIASDNTSFKEEDSATATIIMQNIESPACHNNKEEMQKLKMPRIVLTYDMFFGSNSYDVKLFNTWYKKTGWDRPIHVYMLLHIFLWLAINTCIKK